MPQSVKFLHNPTDGATSEGTMKTCEQCRRPMISDGNICGSCQPSKTGLKQLNAAVSEPLGTSRELRHVDLTKFNDPVHPCKVFALWAVKPQNLPAFYAAISMLARQARMQYRRRVTAWSDNTPSNAWDHPVKHGCQTCDTGKTAKEFKSAPFGKSIFERKSESFKQATISEQLKARVVAI
jgi:hypothetical protein